MSATVTTANLCFVLLRCKFGHTVQLRMLELSGGGHKRLVWSFISSGEKDDSKLRVDGGLYILMTYANRYVYYKALLICCIDVGTQI
jgi:hypothetical protein